MSLNVEQITNRLAQMPDQALQKYAAMNKNDPYIMALAVSESNRRKQMRQAAQGQQGMQPQPKVVDQAVQGMAAPMPEDMGIARLPAGNMNFADGGIVAFADGGGVEHYQVGGTTMSALMAQYEREAQEMGEGRRIQFSPELKPILEQVQAPRRAAEQSFLQREQAQMLQGPALMDRSILPTPAASAPASAAPSRPQGQTPSPRDDSFRRQIDPRILGTPATPPDVPLQDGRATLRAAPTQRTPGAPAAPGTPAASAEPTGIDALSAKLTRDTELAQGALRNMRVGQAQQLVQTAEQDKAEGERMRAARGDVFAAREARLAEREKGVVGMKDQNLGLALLQAGAAMMSTPGNIGMALGKGVQVGSERYVAGIDKINAAKEKFAEARDRLDDLRMHRDDMNEREIRAENRAIRNAQLQGQQLLMDGATNDLKISNENQRAIFGVAAEALTTDKRIKSAENIAAMQERGAAARASMLPAEMRAAIMLGKGSTDQERYLSGAKIIQEASADKSGLAMAKLLATINADERKNGEPLTTAAGLLSSLNQINALMYPRVGDNQPTRARPAQ